MTDSLSFLRKMQDQDIGTLVQSLLRRVAALETVGSSNVGTHIVTPTMPTSNIPVANTKTVPATIYLWGGSGVSVTVTDPDNTVVLPGLTSGTFRVNPGSSITVTYTSAPSWAWYGD